MKKNELVNPSVVKRSTAAMVLIMFLITSASSLATGIESLEMVVKGTGIAGSDLGWNLTEIGYINQDPYMDYAVGAPGYGSGDGRVYVFYGPITSLALTSASWTISGNSSEGGGFGWSIAPCNNYDGDQYDDFIVGAPLEDRAYLFRGGSLPSKAIDANLTLVGEDDSLFGHSVAGLDYEGNGNIVAAVGAPDHDHLIQSIGFDLPTGGVFMYNITKMFQESRKIGNTSNYDFSFMGEALNEKFGFLVKNLGDMDGDGNEDMGIGDPFYDNEKGGLFIQLGKLTMFEYYPYAYPTQMNGWIYGGTSAGTGTPGGRLGWSCASAGDYNFDMNYDIFVGAPFDGEGKVYLFSGVALTALQIDLTLVSPDAEFNGTTQGDRFGWAIGSTPIYNSIDIVTISAPMHDNGTSVNAGAIYSFWPVTTSASVISANDAQAQFFGEAAGDQLGYSLTKAEYRNSGNIRIFTSSPFHGAGDQGAIYLFERNQAPKLSQLLCTPPSGAGDQEFTITVNYTDEDGDRPEYVKLMVYHGDPKHPYNPVSPLLVEYPLTFSHGLNAQAGLFYNIETTLNNSVMIKGIEVIDENLYFIVRAKAVRGTMYEVRSLQPLKGPVVDDISPSRVKNIKLSNETGVKGTFEVSWEWPGEDDFGTLVGDKVSRLHIKIREGEAITEDNWESSDTYYTFSGSGELLGPGDRQYGFTFGTQEETNMFHLQLKPGFSSDYEEHVIYFVAFRGVDDKGNQGPISNPISVEPYWDRPTLLSPIETVTLVDVPEDNGGTLNLSWSASPSIDCTEYRIYITQEDITTILDDETGEYLEPDYQISKGDDPETFKNAWKKIYSYSGGNLLDGQEYYAAVVAVNWLNKLNPEVKMSLPETVINDNQSAIAQARDVLGEDVIGDSVTLKISWTPSTDLKFTKYQIYGQRYSFSNVDDAHYIATIKDRAVSSITVNELNGVALEGGVAYSFAVLVKDYNRHVITVLDDNNTARGVYLIDDINETFMPPIKGVTLRDAPEDEGGSLVISWYKLYVKDRFLFYNIYYDDEPIESLTGLTPIKSIWDNLVGDYEFNESTGQKLMDGRDYYVAVSVVNFDFRETLSVDRNNTAGPVEPINQMDTTPPMMPGSIESDDASRTDTTITVTWNAVSWDDVPDFDHYLITYTGKRSGEEKVEGGREVSEFTIRGLVKGSQYWINLAIVDDAGNVGEATDDIEVYTTGENQAPYNITIKIQAAIGEFELRDDNNTLEIDEVGLGKEVSFTGTALDDYTSYIYLYWQWVITTPGGTVIVKQGYTVETEIKESGDYIISLRVKDEEGLWSDNLTVYMNVEGEEKDPETFKLILLIFLVVIIIVIVLVVFITIKSGKKSRMKEDMKRYEDRQQQIDAMEKIYTDLPSWTCPCGTTQIPITETANCPSCYESHEGVPIDTIDQYLQDHDLVLKEMNITVPLAWQGQDMAIDKAEKDLETRQNNAKEALDEEFAALLGKDEKPAEGDSDVSEDGIAPPDGGQAAPGGTPLGATPLKPPMPGAPVPAAVPPGTPLARPQMAAPPQPGTPLQPPVPQGKPLKPTVQQGTPLKPPVPQGTPLAKPQVAVPPKQATPLQPPKQEQ